MPTKYMFHAALNYAGTQQALNGCHSDQAFWTAVAEKHYGFEKANIVVLKEPTKAQLKEGIIQTLQKAVSHDLVVLGYSGHGTIVPPGVQAWVPGDFNWDNPDTWLSYDELDQLLTRYEAQGVVVVLISDSCHSEADPRMNMRTMNPHPTKDRYLKPPPQILRRIVSYPFERNVVTSGQDDLMLAGCRRDQTSADAWIDGGYCGAFTYAMGLALKENRNASYQEATIKARAWLAAEGYDQVPGCKGAPAFASLPFFGFPTVKDMEESRTVADTNPALRLV